MPEDKKKRLGASKRPSKYKTMSRRRTKRVSRKGRSLFGLDLKILLLGLFVAGCAAFVLIPNTINDDGFQTIKELEAYASKFDEFKIEMEGDNLVKPDYTNHYNSLSKGFFEARWETILVVLGLQNFPSWSVETFQKLMQSLLKTANNSNLSGLFIEKIKTNPGGKIVVWGDISGAFHSLVRDIRELVSLNVLTEDLKVTSPDNYLVFMGDVVSRSPFLMETTSAVMRLVKNNPDNVIYLRGNHEHKGYWEGFGLKRELKIRAEHLLDKDSKDSVPLRGTVTEFFNTLPVSLYASMIGDRDFVRFSHEGGNKFEIVELDEKKYSPFLQKTQVSSIDTLKLEGLESQSIGTVSLKAIIRAEVKRRSYQENDGLRLIDPEDGITSWTVLSCPTEIYRKGLKFYKDAFAILEVGKTPKAWRITLHNRDVRDNKKFSSRSHYLLSGRRFAPGDPEEQAEPVKKVNEAAPLVIETTPEPEVAPSADSALNNSENIGEITFEPEQENNDNASEPEIEQPSAVITMDATQTFTVALECKIKNEGTQQEVVCEVVKPVAAKQEVIEAMLPKPKLPELIPAPKVIRPIREPEFIPPALPQMPTPEGRTAHLSLKRRVPRNYSNQSYPQKAAPEASTHKLVRPSRPKPR
jgi:hypothetical protein